MTKVTLDYVEVKVALINKPCFPCSMSSGFNHVSHDVKAVSSFSNHPVH